MPSPSQMATVPSPSQVDNLLAHLPAGTKPAFTDPRLISCTGNPGPTDPVAIVVMHGQSNPVLRDYANEDHPVNVCTFGLALIDYILSPHLLEMTVDGAPALVEVPSGTIHELGTQVGTYAISPDLSHFVWFSSDWQSLHDTWDGHDVVLQQYPQIGGRCGSPDIDSKPIGFTRDGRFAFGLWTENFQSTAYLNVIANHQRTFGLAPPAAGWPGAGGPLMAVWSPSDTLYYTLGGDVWTWSQASGPKDLKVGTRWIAPAISADGKHIAYMSRDSAGTSTVHLMDPSTGAIGVQVGGAGMDWPYFLTTDLMWVHADVTGCVGGAPPTYIYDLRNNTLYPSALDLVERTWPATSALGG